MPEPTILARGPWAPEQVSMAWRDDAWDPPAAGTERADAVLAGLRDRGSPAHDGLAARLAGFTVDDGHLSLELQPVRWALRLVPEHAADSLSASCVVRDADGRWLAGRRAGWVATWAGKWALGAAGSVEVGENPVETLGRELEEEWSVIPDRLSVEALVRNESGLVFIVGVALVATDAEVTPDAEHDAYAWWPADPADWPAEAHPPLRRQAALLV
ncbi:MAG TPA: NUDIX domain-containing protein [Solirubrobacteraceae bacterium]